MGTVTGAPRHAAAAGWRPAVVVAGLGSAMAGLVHAVAARTHDGDRLLLWLFALCAVAQVLWAVVVLVRPARRVLAVGLVVNGGALLVWALTRTVGIPFVSSLAEVEAVGTQDLAAALLAAASVLGVLGVLLRPVARPTITTAWAGALAVVALLGTMPALRADHEHRDHVHLEAAGHEGEHADDDETAAPHPHDAAAPEEDHEHGTEAEAGDGEHAHDEAATGDLVSHGHDAADGTAHPPGEDAGSHPPSSEGPHGHPADPDEPVDHPHPPADPDEPTGPIISLNDPRLTDAQRNTALALIAGVWNALKVYPNVAAIEAAGYQSIGDGGVDGYEHYVNWPYLADGIELDPARIESIVVKKSAGGGKTIVSGMYILNLGKTMADVPPLAGELTTWHDHQNLCFEGTKLVGLTVNGVCAKGTLLVTPPMLHVWMIEHPCGPFAGIDSHGGDCGVHDDH